MAEISLASERVTSEKASVCALRAASFYVAEQKTVWLMRVFEKEDQLLCIYNLVVFDGVFSERQPQKTCVLLADKQLESSSLA